MKLPSLFRVNQPRRFSMTPRYYDPIKEEIAERTARIKKDLQGQGRLPVEERNGDSANSSGESSIKGAFTKGSPIGQKPSSILDKAGALRLIMMIVLISGIFGYAYLGPEILQYIFYLGLGILLLLSLFKLKSVGNK